MDMSYYVDNLKFQLTGGLLDIELTDADLQRIVDIAFKEAQRYINSTKLATIPFYKCIDLSNEKVNSIYRVYRAESYLSDDGNTLDPMQMAQWQMLAGLGNGLYNNDWAYNYGAWNAGLQIRNTVSTDLDFKFDKSTGLLYVNTSFDKPTKITIEYVPSYDSVDEILSDYWIDKICRLSVAYGKIALGRIRTRYVQSNALWTQDGDKLLEEGNTELSQLREELVNNNNLFTPLD